MQSRRHEMCHTTHIILLFSLISDHSSSNLSVIGASIGVGVFIAVVVGLVILWVLIRRNSRKENTKGNYGMYEVIEKN